MPLSDRQIAANRANSAKSTGPKTPDGKRNSSRNSIKHGLLAKCILIGEESPQAFQALYRSYIDEFEPETAHEFALVENLTVIRWRQFRLWNIESAAIRQEQDRLAEDPAAGRPPDRVMRAVRSLIENSPHSDALSRYETRLDRQYYRAADRLHTIRAKKIALRIRSRQVIENEHPTVDEAPKTNHSRTDSEPILALHEAAEVLLEAVPVPITTESPLPDANPLERQAETPHPDPIPDTPLASNELSPTTKT